MDQIVKAMLKEDPVLVVSLIDTEVVEKARQIHDTLPTATAGPWQSNQWSPSARILPQG
jgi:hypothetical protein